MKVSFKKTVAATVLAGVSSASFAFGTGNMPTVPSGWTLKESSTNIRVYQKGTEQVYAQFFDIKGGAKVRFSQTVVSNTGTKTFSRQTLDQWWTAYTGVKNTMINGQFFDTSLNPTGLSFGVRANSAVLTTGADTSAIAKKQIEFFDNTGVYVTSFNASRLNGGSSAQNIIVGLDPSVDKSGSDTVGRTYLCTKVNPSGPASPSQWLVIVSAASQTQASIYSNITSLGCDSGSVVMFDGSGSTQLQTSGGIRLKGSNWLYPNENRTIPQVLVISN
jgi:hypothetical protein